MTNAWKEAVIEKLVVDCIYADRHEFDPEKAINDLLTYEIQIALDPAVSQAARDLIERGRLLERQEALARTPLADPAPPQGPLPSWHAIHLEELGWTTPTPAPAEAPRGTEPESGSEPPKA